ncbi:hypothetical protein [Microseira sp. BLCC-F43]|uniref:hypothetical protein n=1 Tax=Microseira sp. BLCC-F43 TaxID=3153602 RepID=UPI0035B7633A
MRSRSVPEAFAALLFPFQTRETLSNSSLSLVGSLRSHHLASRAIAFLLYG